MCPLPLEPTSHHHPRPLEVIAEHWAELHALHSSFPLARYFIYSSVYTSGLLSQFFPPSPSPAGSRSLFSTSVFSILALQRDFPVFTTKSAINKLQTTNKWWKACRKLMRDGDPRGWWGRPLKRALCRAGSDSALRSSTSKRGWPLAVPGQDEVAGETCE